jgi:hypothetical protein
LADARHARQPAVVRSRLQISERFDAEHVMDRRGGLRSDAGHRRQFLLGPERAAKLIQQGRMTGLAEAFENSRDRLADTGQASESLCPLLGKNLPHGPRQSADRFRSIPVRLPPERIGRLRVEQIGDLVQTLSQLIILERSPLDEGQLSFVGRASDHEKTICRMRRLQAASISGPQNRLVTLQL